MAASQGLKLQAQDQRRVNPTRFFVKTSRFYFCFGSGSLGYTGKGSDCVYLIHTYTDTLVNIFSGEGPALREIWGCTVSRRARFLHGR